MKPNCSPSDSKPTERSIKGILRSALYRGVARAVLGDEGVGNRFLANVGRIATTRSNSERSQQEVVACQPDVREPFRGRDAPPRQEGNDLRARRRERTPVQFHRSDAVPKIFVGVPRAAALVSPRLRQPFDNGGKKIAFPKRRFRNPPSMQCQIRSVAAQVENEIDDLSPGEDRPPFLDSRASETFERLFDRAHSRERSLPSWSAFPTMILPFSASQAARCPARPRPPAPIRSRTIDGMENGMQDGDNSGCASRRAGQRASFAKGAGGWRYRVTLTGRPTGR